MTNGEKIQTILDIDKDCTEVYGKNGMMTFSVPQDWWNAEYNEPVIRDNGVKNELNRVKDELGVTSELEKNSKLEKDFGELDCISRADAIQAMQDKAKKLTNEDTINGLCGAVAILFELPSVTPQGTKGYWIDTNDNGFVYHRIYKCSHCGATVCEYPENMHESKYKYCSNCGSRNEVEE